MFGKRKGFRVSGEKSCLFPLSINEESSALTVKMREKSFQTLSVSISWKTLEIHSGVILFAYLQEELKEENLDVYFSFKKHCEKYENRDKIFSVHHWRDENLQQKDVWTFAHQNFSMLVNPNFTTFLSCWVSYAQTGIPKFFQLQYILGSSTSQTRLDLYPRQKFCFAKLRVWDFLALLCFFFVFVALWSRLCKLFSSTTALKQILRYQRGRAVDCLK